MSKPTENRSNTPILIIVAVLVIAALGGWWYYSSSSKPGSASNTNSAAKNTNAANKNVIPANAPPGANPPNQSGSPNAVVKLEEFADFQCPQCGAMHPVFNEIKSMYGTRIQFIFRNFPLKIPAHDKAYEAAVAAEAAGLQGKFWDMQNMLFTNQKAWSSDPTYKDIWKGYAQKIGLNVEQWETDRAGIAAKGRVDADIQRGNAIGVNSTPSLYINGQAVPFESLNVNSIKALIDAELAKTSPQGSSPSAPAGNSAPASNTAGSNTNK